MPPALLQERKKEFHGFLERSHGFLDRFVGEIVLRALERTDAAFFFFDARRTVSDRKICSD